MSELKARLLGQTMNEYGCDTKIYLKSEADKVIAELKVRIAELEEERRWRKYSEEMPQDGQEVWAYDSSQKLVIKVEYQVREDCEGFVGFPIIHGFWPFISYWMPYNKPKAPGSPVTEPKEAPVVAPTEAPQIAPITTENAIKCDENGQLSLF